MSDHIDEDMYELIGSAFDVPPEMLRTRSFPFKRTHKEIWAFPRLMTMLLDDGVIQQEDVESLVDEFTEDMKASEQIVFIATTIVHCVVPMAFWRARDWMKGRR